jgi:tetratricopeptide (TPR) repeat protein
MPTEMLAPSHSPDLIKALGEEGTTEYRQLLRVLKVARGHFTLLPTESDFTPTQREALFAHLIDDLQEMGLRLRVLTLTRDLWYLFDLSELEISIEPDEVIVLVGLENTPRIVPESGREPERPPALNALNIMRETIHTRIPVPLIVWCPPFAFDAMMEHAPDFFDHYSCLFHFMNVGPVNQIEDMVVLPVEPQAEVVQRGGRFSRASLEFYEHLVLERTEPTKERARALLGLAETLSEIINADYITNLERARQYLTEALCLLSAEETPYDWSRAHNILGNLLCEWPKGNRTDNLQQAIVHYQSALGVLTEDRFPREWAIRLVNLGSVYKDLPDGNREANLRQAIQCYQEALRVYTEKDYPYEWAGTHHNLGNAYVELSIEARENLLHEAIACYEAALRVRTEEKYPYDWAMTQNSLGNAFLERSAEAQDYDVRRAIVCYEAALRVRTETDYPLQWAQVQSNLGIAYSMLRTGDRTQNLQTALAFNEDALRIYTLLEHPRERARTYKNIGITLRILGRQNEARQAWQAAIEDYRNVGMETEAQLVESWLHALEVQSALWTGRLPS